jgi:putative ABC transport system permease protein
VKILKLALRNVLRNKRRTLVSISVITIGVMGLGIFGGFMHFSFWGIQEEIIHVGMGVPEGTGHFQIFNPKYLDGEEPRLLEYGLSEWRKLIREIEEIDTVAFASPRLEIMGLVSNGEKAEPVMGFGIMPGKEKYMPGIFGSSEPYTALEDAEDGLILGKELAKKMGVEKGEYLTLLSSTVDGAINAIDLRFIGTISTGSPEGDKRFILANIIPAMELLQTEKVRKIVVMLKEGVGPGITDKDDDEIVSYMLKGSKSEYMEKTGEILKGIATREGLEIRTWQQLNSYYNNVKGLYNTIFGFIGIVMSVVVILSIYNTMFMAVVERTREIGTLMAVGTPRHYILLLFLLEGLIIATLGGIIGYGGTYIVSGIISNSGLQMPPPPGVSEGYPLIVHRVYLWWFYIVILIMANTLVASFIPALRAARMNIVNALYHV